MEYKVSNLKPWFEEKFFTGLTEQERYCLQVADNPDGELVRETGKAVCLQFVCDFGKRSFWFPKSAFMTDEEKAEAVAKAEEERNARYERYENLVKFAKEHGLAVRNKMKTSTILAKVKEAGLAYEY